MSNEPTALGSFRFHTDAADAVKELRRAGIDATKLSLIGKDARTDDTAAGLYTVGGQAVFVGKLSAFWGSFSGVLSAAGLFVIPGVGSVMVMGPLVGAVVEALEATAIDGGDGIVASALTRMGIPERSVTRQAQHVASGELLIVVRGTREEVQNAQGILQRTGSSAHEAHA